MDICDSEMNAANLLTAAVGEWATHSSRNTEDIVSIIGTYRYIVAQMTT